ncbi:MAG TPA: hypothetical protein VNX28_07040 [Gemmataceae bacterium]|nr:hypothetical protein [Gemmataceae bacterium]
MAEEHIGQRKEMKAPWTKIFTAFKVALDIKKLLLAAGGIFVTAAGWWLLAVIFFALRSEPPNPAEYLADRKVEEKDEAWTTFRIARKRWNLLYELAGPTSTNPKDVRKVDAGDIAQTWQQYEEISKSDQLDGKVLATLGTIKPHGRLRTWPWFEDRGENPYLLVTDNIKPSGSDVAPALPRERRPFVLSKQLLVLVEPLVKFLSPVAYFFEERAGPLVRVYLLGVILWTLAVWGFFGGAITRMAAVQVARNEKISMRDALRFARERFQSFFSAPVFPLIFLGVLTFFLILFGLFSGLIPIVGDVIIAGLLWPIVIVLGLIMAVVLVGLVGWPLMNATISAEGSDSFDALSRSYSYVYQAPWHYLWYSAVALAYGAVLVFFVGLMGSLMVYLGQWGVSQAPFLSSSNPANDREPTYLFIDAPTSFGWRDLLLHGSQHAERKEVITPNGDRAIAYVMNEKYMKSMEWWNYIGAFLVSVWLYVLFLVIVGFGYSYFWTASTIIYLLMRHKVDDTDLDEIHMEEEETEEPFGKDMTAAPVVPPAPKEAPAGNVTMVEAPSLRPTPAAAPTPGATAPGEAPAMENKPGGDGTPPPPVNP